jgi:hypothetical protein
MISIVLEEVICACCKNQYIIKLLPSQGKPKCKKNIAQKAVSDQSIDQLNPLIRPTRIVGKLKFFPADSKTVFT